jgi:hypothetical protein
VIQRESLFGSSSRVPAISPIAVDRRLAAATYVARRSFNRPVSLSDFMEESKIAAVVVQLRRSIGPGIKEAGGDEPPILAERMLINYTSNKYQ